MTEDKPARPAGGKTLFVHPPQVGQMRDPMMAEWNKTAGAPGPEADPTAVIDFSPMKTIFDNFLDVVGLPICIIDPQGRVLVSSRWQRVCMEFHRVAPGTLARCLESDTSLSRDLAEGKTYALYRCRNGLTDCATPITVEGVHIANLFVGQFLLAAPDAEAFRKQQEEFSFDKDAYAEAMAEVPIVDEDKLPAILRLMGGLAEQIARQSLTEHRVRVAYETVEQEVAARTQELAESHERLHKIADRVPGVVFQFRLRADGNTCIPYASDAIAGMFGAQPDEVRDDASAVFAATHPDDLDDLIASIKTSAEKLTPWQHEFRVRHADDLLRWVGGEALPQRQPDGSTLWHGFITDISERRRSMLLLKARLRLADLAATCSLHDLLVATLDEACALTGAETGFFHFLLPDQVTLSLQAWSTRTTEEFCGAAQGKGHYDIGAAGVWADSVRQRRSVVYNDYATLPNRKGLPEKHAAVRRVMSIPIFRDGLITAVLGVGNKSAAFDDADLAAVEALADLAWDLADRKRAEEALAERNTLVQRRYDSLRALNDIAALPPGRTDNQLKAALTLGAGHLGLPFGILAQTEGNRYTVVNHCAPPEAGFADGQVFALGETYCVLTLGADDVVAIPHVGESGHARHPCYLKTGLEAYIAAPIQVGGTVYGTVNFSSPMPYSRDFDEGDLEFMRLLARWVGSFLERQRAEAEVLAAKEAAEERACELAASNSELEQFAYVASHDLRQPLRMVSSYLTLIERRLGTHLDDEGREYFRFAMDGAHHMDRLIFDLLEYSRVGRHGDPSEPLDLADVATEGNRHLRLAAEEAGATVTLDTAEAPVIGNSSELARLFQNLIGNALKYRAADRLLRVTVSWQRADEGWVVSVADNGIGIAPQHQQDIFKIFRRLHTRKEYDGTGIGLSICQKIVKTHGGRMWVESEPDQGSTFYFTIPAV